MAAMYIEDGYLYGASADPAAWGDSYWMMHLKEDVERWDLVELKGVPADLARKLEDQGTGAQWFSDGYEAANAAAPYAGDMIDGYEPGPEDEEPDDDVDDRNLFDTLEKGDEKWVDGGEGARGRLFEGLNRTMR
jgi:hypothetical protein